MNQTAINFDAPLPESYYDRAMSDAREAGHVGAGRAVQKCAPDFVVRAKFFVLAYLALRGPTPGEILTDMCKLKGIIPTNDKAFGAVYGTLSKQKKITRVAGCDRVKGHGTAGGNVWALAL